MKTDELVRLLAAGGGAVEAGAVSRRYALALGWGACASVLLMAILLGVRDDLAAAARVPMFWVKLAFPATLAAAAWVSATRLSRPGRRLGGVVAALAAPVVVIALLAVAALASAQPGAREPLIFGDTWRTCPFNIALLSAPLFAGALWAMRGLAPTRPTAAGAAAGLLAGACGATIYALHCPELAAPFLALWYVAGILIPAVAGALLGPRLLRW